MKDIPTVVAARDGSSAVELVEFEGADKIANRDAIGFYYTVRLKPAEDLSRLIVLFSDTVFYIKPEQFSLPELGDRERNFRMFSEAAILSAPSN